MGERRPAGVACEPLEPETFIGRSMRAGVEREAVDEGALALAGMAIAGRHRAAGGSSS